MGWDIGKLWATFVSLASSTSCGDVCPTHCTRWLQDWGTTVFVVIKEENDLRAYIALQPCLFLHCYLSNLKQNHLRSLVVVGAKKTSVFLPLGAQTVSLYSISSEWNSSHETVLWPMCWQITLRAKSGISQSRYENKSLGYNLFENMKVAQNMRSLLAA